MLGSPFMRSVSTGGATEHGDSFPEVKGVTNYVGRFIVETGFDSISKDVIELGKKSILDGFGLALAQAAACGGKMQIYIYMVLQCELGMTWTFHDMLINLMCTTVMQQVQDL